MYPLRPPGALGNDVQQVESLDGKSTTEGKNPNALYHIVSDVELNATRAGKLFHDALMRALQAESQSAIASGWRMDKFDRTY